MVDVVLCYVCVDLCVGSLCAVAARRQAQEKVDFHGVTDPFGAHVTVPADLLMSQKEPDDYKPRGKVM
jgi:hypothetical protein